MARFERLQDLISILSRTREVRSLYSLCDEMDASQATIKRLISFLRAQRGNSGSPVLSFSGRVLGIVEASIEEDGDGNPMQLTNFTRNAHVVSLLRPSQRPARKDPHLLDQPEAVSRAIKAVC